MKPLPTEFTRNGWLHKQITRSGSWAVYERTLDGARKHWEVIKAQVAKKDYTFPNGAVVPAGTESYPGNTQWGRNGFTLMSLGKAMEKLGTMVTK